MKLLAVNKSLAVSKVSRWGLLTVLSLSFVLVSQSAFARGSHAKGAQGQGKAFAHMDTNKDGRVSLAEMQQAALTRFVAQDTNKDGFLSAEEMQTAKKARRAGAFMQKRIAKRMEKQDSNKDGKISKAEAQAAVNARFTLLDRNKDGLLKAEEMKAQRAHGKNAKKGRRQNPGGAR